MSDDPLWCVPTSRRGFVQLLLATVPGAIVAYCATSPSPSPSPTPSPTLSVTPTVSPTPVASATPTPTPTPPAAPAFAPAVVRSYGPNGTHWPEHTPWIHDPSAVTVDVACTWAAIAQAIAAVTPEQAAAGVHIKVSPGVLGGFGASSGSRTVLQDLGSATWPRNVLVSPRDGWGTVMMSAGARLRDVHGVTFARIDGTALLLTNCSRTAWAHSKMTTGLAMVASYGATMTGSGAYEVVMPVARAASGDPFGYGAAAGSTLTDCVWEGCYGAPVFRPDGSSAHLDTLQMYGAGWYRGLTVRDTTLFGSPNCALQIGGSRPDDPLAGTRFLTVDHSILTSQATAIRVRYPLPTGVQAPTIGQAINGLGEPGRLAASDSYIFGSMYNSSWESVSNTRVSYEAAVRKNPVTAGSWTYDASMSDWTAAEFDAITPAPDDSYLARIWS